MTEETYDRRKEDRHLTELERRIEKNESKIAEIQGILRFDVVRLNGAWAKRFEALEGNVRMINQSSATKAEIDRALKQQTQELKRAKESRFTKSEKIAGLLFAALLLGVDILHIFIG